MGTARSAVRASLEELGVPSGSVEVLLACYLLELLVRVERASHAGAGRNPRLWPALAHLAGELAGAGSQGGTAS